MQVRGGACAGWRGAGINCGFGDMLGSGSQAGRLILPSACNSQVCASSFLGTARSLQARPQVQRARASVKVQAADRTLWLPGECATGRIGIGFYM